MSIRFFSLAFGVLLVGVPAVSGQADPKLNQQALAILKKCCGRCHAPGGTNEGGIDYILSVPKLIEKKKLVPGDPAKSRLFKQVASGNMPPEDEKPRPTKDEISVLEKWIQQGAATPGATTAARPFKTDKETLTALRDYLRKTPREDRHYQRFFSLTHLHNNKNIKDSDLRIYRAAVAKLVNSLSWKNGIVLPEPIDADQTVLAIDVRKLDWDRFNLWHELLRQYPYGLKHDHSTDDTLKEIALEVYDLAGIDLLMVRADWFVAAASRPPLYHTILRLPTHAYDLERQLKVDVLANFQRDQLARAGFATSGVSGQNRLVERHESSYGAYWKSYDFKTSEGHGNLFRFPLGPSFSRHPYPNLTFVHDGGEMVFNLPNGLQGYFLADGKDRRIDEGPIEVVSDSLRTSGTAKIVNGLSCMACHNHGMKSEFKDTVREGNALQGEARAKVRRLYPTAAVMKKLLDEDSERFLAALEKTTSGFLKVGTDRNKDLKDFPEPVGLVARMYILKEIGLEEAALELGLADPKRLQLVIQANDRLRQLGLGPLATGATIKRETWESLDRFISPCQEAASVLELGTPKRVK